MSLNSKRPPQRTWAWRRWIASAQAEIWEERLQAVNAPPWSITEKPNCSRILLAIHTEERAEVLRMHKLFGGQVSSMAASKWLQPVAKPPLRIGSKLEIIHETPKKRPTMPRLQIPHGMAFGSGDHSTTLMLLRALTKYKDWEQAVVFDLGTGSGVLALAARLFGARKIVATDFDAEAVRTARENEALNFPVPLIRWQQADVKRLRAKAAYNLVVANLFSEILCQAAPQIVASLSPGGQLWLSGILRSQEKEVMTAYRREKLKLIHSVSRGKWILLQWSKP